VHDGAETLFCPEPLEYVEARNDCRDRGLELVSIQNLAEQEWLLEIAISLGDMGHADGWLIGLTDRGSGHEGTFRWIDGNPVSYTAWAHGEPNDWGDGEDCVVMNWGYAGGAARDSDWNDVYCWNENPYICQMPEEDDPAPGFAPEGSYSGWIESGLTYHYGPLDVTYTCSGDLTGTIDLSHDPVILATGICVSDEDDTLFPAEITGMFSGTDASGEIIFVADEEDALLTDWGGEWEDGTLFGHYLGEIPTDEWYRVTYEGYFELVRVD
jgi:hypothetical protein